MLSFVVGTAVRAATHAALAHHYQAHAHHVQLGGPLSFSPVYDGETAIFHDRRVGFSHAIPGFPHAMPILGGPGEPACDAVIGLRELPVSIRYKVDRPSVIAGSAGEYAARSAAAYAENRTGQKVDVKPPRPEQLSAWSVEAAASCRYDLPHADAYGADYEELLVLVRGGVALAVTFRYPTEAVDWLRGALLRSAARGNMRWTGQMAPAQIWPASDFLERGLWGALLPHRKSLAEALAPALELADEERKALEKLLSGIVGREEPPWLQLPRDMLMTQAQALCNATGNANLHQIIHQGLTEVRTMHDLRGFCILLGQAINKQQGD